MFYELLKKIEQITALFQFYGFTGKNLGKIYHRFKFENFD